jgi:hypothetical protein
MGTHAIVFNRGAVPSQAFARQFGNAPPADENDPDAADVQWLSRGLLKAALDYIGQARGNHFQLRAAFYEFSYPPVLEALAAAAGRARRQIVYEAGPQGRGVTKPTSTTNGNEEAIDDRVRSNAPDQRTAPRDPHNIHRLLEDGHRSGLDGSITSRRRLPRTGQRGPRHPRCAVAQAFLDYWTQLSTDPEIGAIKAWCSDSSPDRSAGLPASGGCLRPRRSSRCSTGTDRPSTP